MTQDQKVFISYSMEKIEYIKKLEEGGNVFSELEIDFDNEKIQLFLDGRNFVTVWSKGYLSTKDNILFFKQKIYKTKQQFFLYLSLDKDISILTIYYNQEQLNELTVFITQLIKEFKKN